jgi:sialate O-acetylesterase
VPKFYAVPRNYRIPANLVTPGLAVIAVRVFDHGGDGGLVGRPEDLAVSLATPGAK